MPLAADIVFQLRANNAEARHRTCIPSWIDVVGDCSPDDVERAFILGRCAGNLRADIHSCEPEVIRAVSKNFVYQGTELDLFSKATHWKAYWGTIVAKYLGERVLEVGAGSGTTARLLCKTQHKSWLALEPDAHLAKQIARDKEAGLLPAAVSVQVGTLAGLEQSANFDTILYIDVLEHIAGDRTELQLAFNFLAPGGFLIVLAPAHQFLFTPFDASIGHFRRYDRRSLLDIAPAGLSVETARYLDSAGLLASLGNRFILKSSMPTPGQIKFWDSWLVPASTVLDPITLYNLGKSILVVWRKSAPPS